MTGVVQENGIRRLFALLMVGLLALMPVYVALAEIQATPIVEPTPTEEVVEEEATEVATPASMAAPYSVTPAPGGTLTKCSQGPGGNLIFPGGEVVIQCDLTFSELSETAQSGRVYRPHTMPPGVTASIHIDAGFLGTTSYLGFDDPGGYAEVGNLLINDQSPKVTIIVRAGSHDEVADSIKFTFESCVWRTFESKCEGRDGSATVELNVMKMNAVQGTNYDFGCARQGDSPGSFNTPIVFDCTIRAGNGIGTNALVVREVSSSLDAVDGWKVEYIDAAGGDLAFPAEPPPNFPEHPTRLTRGKEFLFEIRITPTACGAGDVTDLDVYTRLKPMAAAFTLGPDSTGKAVGLSTGFSAPALTITNQHISVLPSSLPVIYSLSDQMPAVIPELQVQYSVQGCGHWTSTLQISPFQREVDLMHGAPVPQITGLTDVDTNLHIGPQDISSGLDLDEGTDPVIGEEYNHSFNLQYTIPANTPVGTYTSTITVTNKGDEPE